jgi:RNA polymerase sigma-70 factor (ECF subfamily)
MAPRNVSRLLSFYCPTPMAFEERAASELSRDADRAMDRYADGDDQAFPLVYDAVAARLAVYVARQVRDPELARDLVQQTFLQIHRARSTFLRGEAVLPWAFAIARRLIIDAARMRRARPVTGEPGPDDGAVESEDRLVARDAVRRVAAILGTMPPLQRQAFELLKQDGMSLAQAAGLLGTTVAAVKLRAHRALATLRSMLERERGR